MPKILPSELDLDAEIIAEEIAYMLRMEVTSVIRNKPGKIYFMDFGSKEAATCGCSIPMQEIANMSKESVVNFWFDKLIDTLDSYGD